MRTDEDLRNQTRARRARRAAHDTPHRRGRRDGSRRDSGRARTAARALDHELVLVFELARELVGGDAVNRIGVQLVVLARNDAAVRAERDVAESGGAVGRLVSGSHSGRSGTAKETPRPGRSHGYVNTKSSPSNDRGTRAVRRITRAVALGGTAAAALVGGGIALESGAAQASNAKTTADRAAVEVAAIRKAALVAERTAAAKIAVADRKIAAAQRKAAAAENQAAAAARKLTATKAAASGSASTSAATQSPTTTASAAQTTTTATTSKSSPSVSPSPPVAQSGGS